MSLFTEYEFSKCVKRYKGDRHSIKFNCRDQFLVMSFAQYTDRSGLRDIETTLDLCSQDLYRSGLKIMPKSTLAEANEKNSDLTLMKWFVHLTAAPLNCAFRCVHGRHFIMGKKDLKCIH